MAGSPLLFDLTRFSKDRFQVACSDPDGSVLARSEFEWRTETLAFEEDLKHLKDLAVDSKLRNSTFHVKFGQKLYRALLGKAIQELLKLRLESHKSVPLILRVDPTSAPALSRLPWELMHDGSEFIALNPRTPIARLSWGLRPLPAPSLGGSLRLLVVVSNPDDLPETLRLDVEAEREHILIATEKLQREGRLGVDFLEDASLESIEDALTDNQYHLLHLAGHGDFDRVTQQGVLLLEDEQGHSSPMVGADFVKALRGSDLRFILVSAYNTAKAAQGAVYRDVVSQLAAAGFAASLAMQYPIADIAATEFAEIYPLYLQKAKHKNRTKAEVDQTICWLTGYNQAGLRQQIEQGNDLEIFFAQAPALNPNRSLIKGVVCGVRVEDIDDPLLQNIRYLDKLIDELAKGKALEKILRPSVI